MSDSVQSKDDDFEPDALDNLDFKVDEDDSEDDSDDSTDEVVSKKRKRARTEVTDSGQNHSKLTDARIKLEGGEAFILEEGASSISHLQSSRVFGTFGRRKFNLKFGVLFANRHEATVRRVTVCLPTTSECLHSSIPTMSSCLRCERRATATVRSPRSS